MRISLNKKKNFLSERLLPEWGHRQNQHPNLIIIGACQIPKDFHPLNASSAPTHRKKKEITKIYPGQSLSGRVAFLHSVVNVLALALLFEKFDYFYVYYKKNFLAF